MFKDKDKQREAQRNWVRQKRKGSTDKGSTKQGSTVIPCESHIDASDVGVVKALHRLIKALPMVDKDQPYQMTVMERLFYRPASELGRGQTNFVSLPGRACYNMFKRKARG